MPTGGITPYIYSDATSTCTAPGGATAITGLTVNSTTGAYSYTTPATAGLYYYCIKVCDASTPTPSCQTATYTVNVTTSTPLTVSNPPVLTPTAGSGTQNGNAATQLAPTGGTAPYTYSNDTGNPSCSAPLGATAISGVSVNSSTGAYSYTTPTTAGAYYFCIKTCDSGSPQQCVTKTYTVNVAPTALIIPTPAALTPVAGSGAQTGQAATPTGGTGPYTYTNGSGLGTCTAPGGATLLTPVSVNSSTGAFSYTTPTTPGTYYFCIQTCDASSPTPQCVNTTYTVNVAAPSALVVPTPAPLTPVAGSGAQTGQAATPTGGTAPYTYTNGSGLGTCTAPGGATLLTPVSVNSSTGAFSYTTPTTPGTYYFCIQTCDASSPTPQCVNTTYTVNVAAPSCAAAAQTLSK